MADENQAPLDKNAHDAALASLRAHLKCAHDAALDVASHHANTWGQALVQAVERAVWEARFYGDFETKRRSDEAKRKAENHGG